MDRRNFIKASIGAAVAAQMPLGSVAQTEKPQIARKVSEMKKLSLRSVRIATGIEKPFSALHLSDSHLTFADTRDDERKWKLAAGRQRIFLRAEHYLNEAITFANRHEIPILHTGDLIDFVSEANLDMVAAHFQQADWFVAAGNHEYSQYVGEALEDAAYRAAS
ncbi:MAG: metallophosphoesterase, partial [Bacteroidaceae bacterium]|nr:metallophosphoesterase [Bacteroidaceae bacterium]